MVNKASRTRLKKTPKKSGFVYRPRKLEDVKRRAERPAGRFDSYFKAGFDSWRPKVGENVIRILPPTWEDSHEHYGYTIWVHSWVGPDKSTYLCPAKMKKKPCPICEAAEEARKAGEDDEYKHLNMKEQTVFWIIDRDDDDQQPQLYAVSGQMDRDILSQTISSRSGKAIMIDHPDEGYDVFIKRTGQGLKTRYVCSIDRDPSPIEDKESEQEEILTYVKDNSIPSVLKFYNEEYLEKVIAGTMEQKDEDTEDEEEDTEEEEERPRGKRGKPKPRKDEDEEEEEEEEDTEEEEEAEDKKRPRGRRGKPAPKDEDEDENEDEEDETEEEEEDTNGEEDEEDEEETVTRTKRTRGKPKPKDEEDEDEDEEETTTRTRRRVVKKRARR
jgi:hypothetical protein